MAYLYQEDITDALIDISKAITLNPKYSHAYFSRGYCYQLLGKSEESLIDLNKAIELEKDYKDAYIEIAFVYFKNGETEKACKELDLAILSGCSISEELKKTFCK